MRNKLFLITLALATLFVFGCKSPVDNEDVVAPTVSSTSPANLATGVSVGANITATFSEDMDPATIIAANFSLMQGATSIPGAVSYIGSVAIFNPTAALANDTVYTATIDTGVTDLAGNALAANKVWSFTTAVETTPPTVSSTSPADDAVGVAIGSDITATFSEAMDPTTIVAANFTLMQGATSIPGAVSYVGLVATFNPTAALANDTVYTATIDTGVTDLAGNALATNKVWTFTTAVETTPPTISSKSPAAGASNVAIGVNVTATFSEAMDPATIIAANFTLMQGATSLPGAVSYSGNVATFNPTTDLAYNTIYTATVDTGVTDLAGNPLAANEVWTFTTMAAPDLTPPLVSLTSPADAATNVLVGANVTATFNEAMAAATIIAANFTLKQGATTVPGAVSYSGNVATYNPTSNLSFGTVYTATVTTGVEDLAGNALATNKVWTFTTEAAPVAGPAPVDLGSSINYVILAKSAIGTVPTSAVTGDLGLSPAAASFVTGFSLVADASNVFATSTQVTGSVYAADYAPPTPSNLTTAVSDMQTAYTDAAGRVTPDFIDLGAGEIGGQTLIPGLYKWGSTLLISTDVTLNGGANDVWIFQISGDLTQASSVQVHLTGGALAKNIFWQVAGTVSLGTTAHFEGIVLCQTAISLGTGASVNGRLMSQTAVTINGSTVVEPAP